MVLVFMKVLGASEGAGARLVCGSSRRKYVPVF